MSGARRITILGSTGSIGTGALDVVDASPGDFDVVGLSAFRNTALLAEQATRFGATRVAVGDGAESAEGGGVELPSGVERLRGPDGLETLAGDPDIDLVVNALVGGAGLGPAMAAVRAGHRLAIANKESLVAAGELLTALMA